MEREERCSGQKGGSRSPSRGHTSAKVAAEPEGQCALLLPTPWASGRAEPPRSHHVPVCSLQQPLPRPTVLGGLMPG